MKICLLTAFHASWTKQEVSILKQLRHTVYLLYPSEHALLGFFRVSRLGVLLRNLELFFKCIPACLRSDLIYCWFVFPTGLFAVFLGKLFRKPVILNAAGYDVACVPTINYGTPARWYFRPFLSWTLKNARKVVAISRETAHGAEIWGANNVEVIYEGINIEKFKPSSKGRAKKGDKHILLTVLGLEKALVKRKDLRSLFESLPEVTGIFPNVKLIVVGKKGGAYPFLKQIVRGLGIEENVVFKGFVSEFELVELYNQCDVFIFPSLYEGFPTVCAEAQACEKPVISTSVSSMPEVIKDEETGILVKPRDPKALAYAIKTLLSDSSLRRRLGRSGRKRVVRFFSKEIRKKKLQEMVARALAK